MKSFGQCKKCGKELARKNTKERRENSSNLCLPCFNGEGLCKNKRNIRGIKLSPEHRKKISETRRRLCAEGKIVPWSKGRHDLPKGFKHSIESRQRMSLAQMGNKKGLGKKPSAEALLKRSIALRGRKLSEVHIQKISEQAKKRVGELNPFFGKTHTEEMKRKLSLERIGIKKPEMSGEKCHLWRGGVSSENSKIRSSCEYRGWRRKVFERDNYTCVLCGARSGKGSAVFLNADHIKPFAYFPELRLDVDNGRTLCAPCHRKTDTYGRMGRHKQMRMKKVI